MNDLKLNVLLGKTDHLSSVFNAMIKDYSKFFKNSQEAFRGVRKTFDPVDDNVIIDQNDRGEIRVQTTVLEKFDWFNKEAKSYVDSLFSIEKTNSSGSAKSKLLIGEENWGEFTSLELLRLKSVLENKDFKDMLENIPVRSDSEIWEECTFEAYKDRKMIQSPLMKGSKKTTEKEQYILKDPNIKAQDSSNYVPQVSVKNTTVILGATSFQKYTGELSQRQKAEILKRRSLLVNSVIQALKKCNETEAIESKLDSKKIFGYILGDQ